MYDAGLDQLIKLRTLTQLKTLMNVLVYAKNTIRDINVVTENRIMKMYFILV